MTILIRVFQIRVRRIPIRPTKVPVYPIDGPRSPCYHRKYMRQVVYISDQPGLLRRIPLDLVRDRDLVRAFIRRDTVLNYRSRWVALAWALLEPLLYVALFTFVFTAIMDLRPMDPNVNTRLEYALLVLTGHVPWFWTTFALERGTVALTEHAALIRKATFARETAPLAAVVSGFARFLLAGVMLFVLLTVFIAWPGRSYAMLPVVILIHGTLLYGAALLLSLSDVHFRDMRSIVRVVLWAGFFLTPVFYSSDLVRTAIEDSPLSLGWAKPAYYMNPLAGVIDAYRDIMMFDRLPAVDVLIWPGVAALASLGLGSVLFRRQAPTVSDLV